MATLAFAGKIEAQRRAATNLPAGCISTVISPELELRMPVAGLLDVTAELTKAENQRMKLVAEVRGLEVTMGRDGYEKTKAEIRTEHKEKLASGKALLVKIEESIALFSSLMTQEQINAFREAKAKDIAEKLAGIEVGIAKVTADPNAKLSKKDQKQLLELQTQKADLVSALAAATAAAPPLPSPSPSSSSSSSFSPSTPAPAAAPSAAPTPASPAPASAKQIEGGKGKGKTAAKSAPSPAPSSAPAEPAPATSTPPQASPKDKAAKKGGKGK